MGGGDVVVVMVVLVAMVVVGLNGMNSLGRRKNVKLRETGFRGGMENRVAYVVLGIGDTTLI